ncbi:unnamed protein product [Schistocephalus solidus]|uniref:Sequestosome-1 n=1 Tax=Schistocephalus solidus TaxID=70667 RepID=A0A0V0JB45_SCHSO|nr:unnamed protein product [Schistocephalus solidus]
MALRIKFIGRGVGGEEEIHIWSQPSISCPIKLNDLSDVVIELFGYPQESKIAFTWFDGEDLITIGSCSELQQVVKDHVNGISGAPFSVLKALRLNVTCNSQHQVKQPTMHTTTSSVCASTTEFSVPSIDRSRLHANFACDGCEGNIYDIRYKCLKCVDFDLCSHCFAGGKHLEHPFGAVRYNEGQRILIDDLFSLSQAIISHTYDVSLARSVGTQTLACYTQEQTHLGDIPASLPVKTPELASCPTGGTAEWEVLSDDSDSEYVFGNEFSAKRKPTETSPVEGELTEPLPESQVNADPKNSTSASLAIGSVSTTECPSYTHFTQSEPTSSVQECMSSFVQKPKLCTSSQTSLLLDEQTKSPPRMRIATSSVGYFDNGTSETANETRHTGVCTVTPAALDPVSPSWSLGAVVKEAIQCHADYIVDAFRKLQLSPAPSTSVDELKVLLDAGYSNEDGILTFLLSENGNNAAAVLEMLNRQKI